MDAVSYLKAYERMREAEGLLPFEPLFSGNATPEEKVALVEEWDRENKMACKNVYDFKTDELKGETKGRSMLEIMAEVLMRMIELEIRVEDAEDAILELEEEVL